MKSLDGEVPAKRLQVTPGDPAGLALLGPPSVGNLDIADFIAAKLPMRAA
jgi:hypothetical protein